MVATTAKKKSHLINEAQKLNIFFVPFVNDLIMFLRVCSCLIKDVFLPNKIKNKGLLTLKKNSANGIANVSRFLFEIEKTHLQ